MGKNKRDAKHFFGGIPARAGIDDRLQKPHWRVLHIIALHDRMGSNGQGCWAGNKRLKELAGCHYTDLSTTISDLVEWGYLERRPDPRDGRRTVLFVIYDDEADAAVTKRADENNLRTDKGSSAKPKDEGLRRGKQSKGTRAGNGLGRGKQSADDRLREADEPAEVVCPERSEAPEGQGNLHGEYIQRSCEAYCPEGLKAYSAEAGTPPDGDAAVVADDGGADPDDDLRIFDADDGATTSVSGRSTRNGKPWFFIIEGGGGRSGGAGFATFCEVYPPIRHGWTEKRRTAALREFERAVQRGVTPEEIIANAQCYAAERARDGNIARTQVPENWLQWQRLPGEPAF